MIARLSFAVLLTLSTPAAAQEPPPAAGVTAPSSSPDPEAVAALAEATGRVETVGRALEAALAELTPRLAEVQADTTTPDAVRTTRALNLVAARQLEIDAMADAVHDLILQQALVQGMARAEAETLAATVRN